VVLGVGVLKIEFIGQIGLMLYFSILGRCRLFWAIDDDTTSWGNTSYELGILGGWL
jgi:hypothetical protein